MAAVKDRSIALFALALLALSPARALGQEAAPQRCGEEPGHAEYGELHVGSVVVPQRHRFVAGDPNWEPAMGRFLGRVAHVARLSGVDARGCPGVRLDVDGGRYFWRVRDLNVGDARPRAAAIARDDGVPEACGRTDASARYGSIGVGAVVVLGRHRPVDGDDNWSDTMGPYVGRTARVSELAGVDERGCAGVHVDVDEGEWFWRVRDLRPADIEAAVVYEPGLASDHGRAASSEEVIEDDRVPQACGMTDDNAQYGRIEIGTEVVLGRHRPVDGEANWVEEMDRYVGRSARVTELVGVDDQGCPLLRVDVDGGDWFWRLRDVQLR